MSITKRKTEILLLAGILLLQSVIFVLAGMDKEYIHMDEAYSLGLTSYEMVEFQDNEDFYDTWHDGAYYMDYLVLDEDEAGSYRAVYENQRDDVHPPLYYLLLRFAMGFCVGEFSVWPGIIVNVIIQLFVTVVTYLILDKLFRGHDGGKKKAMVLTLLSALTLSSVAAVIYMRMYALAALWVVLTAYLHMLLAEKHFCARLMLPIGTVALLGSLTHYYYLFFLAMTYLVMTVGYIRRREWRYAGIYTGVMVLAAAVSLLVFPYSLQHMFFGYRGEGAAANMMNPGMYFSGIGQYLMEANKSMNHLLFVLLGVLVIGAGILAYKLLYLKDKTPEPEVLRRYRKGGMLRMIYLPVIFYFLLVAIASPWCSLRYLLPICPLIFIAVIYGVYWIVCRIMDERMGDRVLAAALVLMTLVPSVLGSVPEELFTDRADIVEKLEGEYNLPTVYFYDIDDDRFLDDILLFSRLDESYIANEVISHDKRQDKETVKEIFRGKDTSQGIILFINGEQLHWVIIDTVREALGLQNCEKLTHLNACDVYYIS